MPAFCTHYLFLNDLKVEIKSLGDYCFNVAAIGTQGPDIFFFHKLTSVKNSKRRAGVKLHNAKPEDIFNAFTDYIKSNPNKIAKSYAYGFIFHYALDRKAHPYIFAKEKEITDKNKKIHHSAAHNDIETNIDAYMINKRLGMDNPKELCTDATFNATNEQKLEIGRVLSYVIEKCTDERVTPQQVIEAINDSQKFQRISRDTSGLLFPIIKAIETPIGPAVGYYKGSVMIRKKEWKTGEKFANTSHQAWHSPFEKEIERHESFEDLYNSAKSEAINLLFGFEELLNGKGNAKELTNNLSFLSGTEVK